MHSLSRSVSSRHHIALLNVTLVRAFVVSCSTLLADAPTSCNVSSTQRSSCIKSGKYDGGLTHFQRHVLHWLDVADRIRFRLLVQVFRRQHIMAPGYLAELCRPVSSIDGHRYLRTAPHDVTRVRLSTYGGRVFCHAGPSAWNALPV